VPLIFPEDIPHVSSLEKLLQNDGPVLWPCIEPKTLIKGRLQSLGSATHDGGEDTKYSYDDAYQGAGWSVLRVKNALLRGDLIQTTNGDVLATVPWWRVGMALDCFDRTNQDQLSIGLTKALSTRQVEQTLVIEGPCTIFHQGPHGHWLFEGLLPLGVWKKIGLKPGLLANEPCPKYRKEFLDSLGYAKEERIFADRTTHDVLFSDLWCVVPWLNKKTHLSPLNHGWTVDRKHCYDQSNSWWLNASETTLGLTQILGADASVHLGVGDRIFVKRENLSRHRICLNEAEVLRVAERYGFVGISPSHLSAEAESATFSQAKIICGSVGGGINNAVFSKPGTRVICLAAQDDVAWPLQGICSVNQLDLTVVYSTQFSSMDTFYSGILSPYAVDLIAFEDLLRSL
jgi:hypothetical protein